MAGEFYDFLEFGGKFIVGYMSGTLIAIPLNKHIQTNSRRKRMNPERLDREAAHLAGISREYSDSSGLDLEGRSLVNKFLEGKSAIELAEIYRRLVKMNETWGDNLNSLNAHIYYQLKKARADFERSTRGFIRSCFGGSSHIDITSANPEENYSPRVLADYRNIVSALNL